ncbi:MAG: glutathione S-transferase family protein [Rhodothalassiaceae bacterium]
MPIVEPENRTVKALRGVHLYHSPFSNCSQRVRLVLEEKAIPWQSHPIDLTAFEHLTPEYQGIHPKGVVPALVHDGTLITESHDIIQYLDDHFDGPRLMPGSPEEAARIRPWMEMGAALQDSIKTLTFERIFRDRYPPTREKYEFYAAHQRNPELVAFYRRYLEGFDPAQCAAHEARIRDFLARADAALATSGYLAGEAVSLADFSAVVNVHRAGVLGIDLADYPHVKRWYQRMAARPSFERAILAYLPR